MSEIPVTLTATDEASPVIASAAGSIDSSMGGLQGSIGSTSTAMVGMGGSASRMGIMGMASFMMMDAASERLQQTQIMQTMAQERLTTAVQKYGAGSTQAVLASQQLQAVTDLVQRSTDQYYMRLAMMAGMMLPQVISMFSKLANATQTSAATFLNLGTETQALSAAQIQEIAAQDGVVISDTEASAISTELTGSLATQTATTWGLTNARLALLAASGVGLIAALAIGSAIAGGAFNPSGNSTNVNVYGDVNLPASPTSPAGFANSLAGYRG